MLQHKTDLVSTAAFQSVTAKGTSGVSVMDMLQINCDQILCIKLKSATSGVHLSLLQMFPQTADGTI